MHRQPRSDPRLHAPGAPADRSAAKLGIGLVLFFSLLALFASLALYQLTSEGTARRTLRRSIATLTEIDPLLDRNYADLQQRAGVASPGDTLYVRDYPIPVPLTPAQATGISRPELRGLLLDRSADVMYDDGTAALRDPAAKAGSVGVFSIAGISSHGLGFLRGRNNDILRVLTIVLAAVSLVLAALLASICRGAGRMGAVGFITLMAAIPVMLAGVVVWVYARANDGASAEYTKRQFAEIGGGLAWIPIRDGGAFAVLGGAMLVLAVIADALADRRVLARYDEAPRVP